MTDHTPTRDEALKLLHTYNDSENLRNHAYAVEAVMRYMARKQGQDEEKWGVIGLIHDLDYEKFPNSIAPRPEISCWRMAGPMSMSGRWCLTAGASAPMSSR